MGFSQLIKLLEEGGFDGSTDIATMQADIAAIKADIAAIRAILES